MTGAGVKEFFEAVDASRAEYERHVLCPTLSTAIAELPFLLSPPNRPRTTNQ